VLGLNEQKPAHVGNVVGLKAGFVAEKLFLIA
jgi:hypothetical protein